MSLASLSNDECPSRKCKGRVTLHESGVCIHCGAYHTYGEGRDLGHLNPAVRQMRERNERGRKARWRKGQE
jgi:hypothetical protein